MGRDLPKRGMIGLTATTEKHSPRRDDTAGPDDIGRQLSS